MSDRALYYPYIHIHDVNWLKATLLLFSQVRRMLPELYSPSDDPRIQEFATYHTGKEYLLQPAAVWEDRAVKAQSALAERLLHDAEDPAFGLRFGSEAAWNIRDDPYGFQVRHQKLALVLRDALDKTKLAWVPGNRKEYIEMHPAVGEVVMSILAIACAEGEGLDIVGDRRSGMLHSALIEKDSEAVYNAWLHAPAWPVPPAPPTKEKMFEFLLGFQCDLGALTPESVAELGRNREPLKNLLAKLRDMTADVPPMDPGPAQDQYFSDRASEAIAGWRDDRRNLPHFWRVFFGDGVAEPGIKFAEKVSEKLLEGGEKAGAGALAGAFGAVATGAGTAGAVLVSLAGGASAGLLIGVLVHAGKSYARMVAEEQGSPYRFLTLLEDAGVVFRSEAGRSSRSPTAPP
jgi:hypothetical protein